MLIANPIYDVVFKYLMEDNKVAKLLISSIIGMKINDLDFQPQEFVAQIGELIPTKKNTKKKKESYQKHSLSVYRLDFKAKISTPQGERIVIIEIQKAKFVGDMMR
ncbi:MAG: hypothetical protein EAZ97_06495, partial [Bacteroidetes bacterium]